MSSPSIPLFWRCRVCGEEKPFTAEFFNRDKTAVFGLSYRCRECARRNASKWLSENRERNRANCKSWYTNNQDKVKAYQEREKPTRPAKRKPWEKRYRERHRAERVAYNRKYRADHREWARERHRDWYRRNPAKAKEFASRRRTAEGKHTADDLRLLYALQEGRCAYCGITLHGEYHVDHVQPISRGGSNWPDNLAIACRDCNHSKSNKTVAEWLAVRNW